MNRNEKYFVALISSHLNNQPPPPPENTDWEEIYRLAGIHNVCAIIANQIFMLKPEEQPNAETLSKFRQQMGYTVIDSDEKKRSRDYIRKLFTENKMEYMFVKGAILRNYYPVKDFRTGSDTDVLIRNKDMDKCRCLIEKTGFSALLTPEFTEKLNAAGKKQVVIFGIEAHICVYQTICDLIERGYEVYFLKDCSASRNKYEFKTGVDLIKQCGAKVTCCEIVLFEWLRTSKHPDFKSVQALIK